jgi:hypothetical protein
LQGAVYHLTSRGNAKQVIFLAEKDFTAFLRSLIFGGKKISLHITCLLSDEQPLSSTYGNPLRVTYPEG